MLCVCCIVHFRYCFVVLVASGRANSCKVCGSSTRETNRSAMLRKAFVLLLYNMARFLTNSSWADEAIDYRTYARPTFCLCALPPFLTMSPTSVAKREGRRYDELNFTSQT